MAKWQSTTESGILRKNHVTENHEELLVFGYACKLFRDDEKALYIDKGQHLIPWMGDETLKIDRYDGRGTLSELTQFEASREGYDTTRWLGLNESERRIEQLCDEERYYALNVNEEEEALYKEEELKREQQKNNEFQFNYDVQPEPEPEKVPTVEMEDEPFVPPTDLDVPSDIPVPSTVKENTRIEKTALFVSKQGLQMEILIKTKQANNPQFSFLNQQDPLHKYYKHLLMVIKSGRYKVQSKENSMEQSNEETKESEASEEHYLHPSLIATPLQSAPPPPPSTTLTIPYRPSANCKYLQLVNRIQGNQQQQFTTPAATELLQPEVPPTPPQNSAPVQQLTYEQQYYQQYCYAMQYYEYYKQLAQQYTDGEIDPKVAQYFQNLAQFSNFMQAQGMQNAVEMHQQMQTQMPDNPYAQIVSNLIKNKDQVSFAPVTTVEQGQQQQADGNIAKAPVIYGQEQSTSTLNTTDSGTPIASPKPSEHPPEVKEPIKEDPKPPKKHHPLLHFAHYNSDSNDSDSDNEDEDVFSKDSVGVVTPGQEIQLIIEKMASYVSKNGSEFENIVKAKGDPRFEFLNDGHKFHGYYKQKLQEFTDTKPKEKEKEVKKQHHSPENKAKEKKIIAPVSFSIKKTKEEAPKEIKSALPVEESDDEEENSSTNASVAQPSNENCSPSRTPPLRNLEQLQSVCPESEKPEETVLIDGEDPILEMIDLTDDAGERRENKRAEDRKKDKIAAAARERLALQLERKRKAAAFLKLMTNQPTKPLPDTLSSKSVALQDTPTIPVTSFDESENYKSSRRSTSREGVKKKITKDKDPTDNENGEVKKHKSSKKKKSHKRKHSRDKHESRHHHKDHKKSKKRRRSKSVDSHNSNGS